MSRFARPAQFAAAAILAAVWLAAPATAQSAEETVALMLWGLEEGATTRRVAENLWEAEGYNGERFNLSVQRLTDCRFRASNRVQRIDVLEPLEFDYIFDFAAVHDYSAWPANRIDQRIIVKIDGVRWYSKTVRDRETGVLVQNITGGSVDVYVVAGGSVPRLQKAFAHFRTAFCPSHYKEDTVQSD